MDESRCFCNESVNVFVNKLLQFGAMFSDHGRTARSSSRARGAVVTRATQITQRAALADALIAKAVRTVNLVKAHRFDALEPGGTLHKRA